MYKLGTEESTGNVPAVTHPIGDVILFPNYHPATKIFSVNMKIMNYPQNACVKRNMSRHATKFPDPHSVDPPPTIQ